MILLENIGHAASEALQLDKAGAPGAITLNGEDKTVLLSTARP